MCLSHLWLARSFTEGDQFVCLLIFISQCLSGWNIKTYWMNAYMNQWVNVRKILAGCKVRRIESHIFIFYIAKGISMHFTKSNVEPRFILGESSHNIYSKMERTKHWWKVEFPPKIHMKKGRSIPHLILPGLPVERKKTEVNKRQHYWLNPSYMNVSVSYN